MDDRNRCCVDFTSVIKKQLDLVKGLAGDQSYDRHEAIYLMDAPADALFLLKSGRVKVGVVSPEGKEKILQICEPGDFFGELCMCGVARRPDQAIALEAASLTSFSVESVARLLSQRPELTRDFFQLVCARLLDCQDEISAVTFQTVPRRLARELLRLSESEDRQREKEAVRLGARLTHEDLAARVGTSRGMITTLMNEFREQRLVDYEHQRIHVFPVRLRRYLEKSAP